VPAVDPSLWHASLAAVRLVLPRPLVLAALLVVMAGARVAQPSRSDAAGALAADVTTWTITGRGASESGLQTSSSAHVPILALEVAHWS
jgi:hypothetical protein